MIRPERSLSNLLGVDLIKNDLMVKQGQEGQFPLEENSGFLFVMDNFYNSIAAIWFFRRSSITAVYEEQSATISVSNSSARLYCRTQI